MILAVTGTDTGVGKTMVTAALAAALTADGRTVAAYKPVQTGESPAAAGAPPGGDIGEVGRLAGSGVLLSEGARFAEPMAPVAAASLEGHELPGLEAHLLEIDRLEGLADVVLVEGAGGLLVQLTGVGHTIADLCRAAGGRLVVVARPGLGTLNHTALTLEAARARGVDVAGVAFGSWPDPPSTVESSNRETLHRACADAGVPWWGALPGGARAWEPEVFAREAVRWFAAGASVEVPAAAVLRG